MPLVLSLFLRRRGAVPGQGRGGRSGGREGGSEVEREEVIDSVGNQYQNAEPHNFK